MRFRRTDTASDKDSKRERMPAIEPLEPRQLLSVSPIIISTTPAPTGPVVHVPVTVDFGSVSGTVTDSRGAGIGGALVVIAPTSTGGTTGTMPPAPHPVLIAKTDDTGKFSLPKVPVGSYTATAHKQGFNDVTSARFSITKGNNTAVPPLVLTPVATGSVNGTVVDSSGKGIAGATVVLSSTATPPVPIPRPPSLVAHTDANGNYSFATVPTGTYTATALKPGYEMATSAGLTVTQGKTTTVPPITLMAVPAPTFGTVTGLITDTSGKPLAGARVELSPAPTSTGTGGMPAPMHGPVEMAITNSSGQYTLNHVPTGTYVITAIDKGYQKATSAPFTVKVGSNTAPTVKLAPVPAPVVGSVSGLVTDSAGKPISDALVTLMPVPPAPGATPPMPPLHPLSAMTDSNGQYHFAIVPVGTYVATAMARGFQKANSAPFTVVQGTNKGPTLVLKGAVAPV